MRIYLFFIALLVSITNVYSKSKGEIRAVWLTTAYGLDWPCQDMTKSKGEMDYMLDMFSDLGVNTVMFQCRIRGDVSYRSGIEPVNRIFSGYSYDPLEYVVNECHRRGMECHAWIVCIPVGTDANMRMHGSSSVLRKNRKLLLNHKGRWYMNPALEGTASYLSGIACEIVRNYDVDGIHLDYIRYPDDYRNFPNRKWAAGRNAASERRKNITRIVKRISDDTRKINDGIEISCAAIGKYNDTSRFPSSGWNAYESLGQDIETWLSEGYVDVVYPMVYFSGNDFYPFIADWKERFGSERIVPVLALYKLDAREANWPTGEIERQINFCNFMGIDNLGLYRAEHLVKNTKGIFSILKGNYWGDRTCRPSVLCNIPEAERPEKPEGVNAVLSSGALFIEWKCAEGAPEGIVYRLYGSDTYPVDISKAENVIDLDIRECRYKYIPVYGSEEYWYFALTAVDCSGNESEPVYISMPGRILKYKDFVESGAYLY